MERDLAGLVYTVPIVMIIALRYCLDIENGADGDPMALLFSDHILAALAAVLLAVLFVLFYCPFFRRPL